MTELLIVSKPRGRIFKWIYGGYKKYRDPVSASKSDSVADVTYPSGESTITGSGLHSASYTYRAVKFTTPDKQGLALRMVELWLSKYGSPTGTLYVELWSDNGGAPGSKIADIGSIDVSTLTTDSLAYQFTPPSTILLDPATDYWLVAHYNGGNTANYVRWIRIDDVDSSYVRAQKKESGSWSTTSSEWHKCNIYFKFTGTLTINLDFAYSGMGAKRLEATVSGSNVTITSVDVNGRSIGSSLERTSEIPEANNYTVVFHFDSTSNEYSLEVSVQRWIYYNKKAISLNDLDFSEAYLQEVEFGSDGGVLRIDDDPDGELTGSANEKIILTGVVIPFRKLEWISGSGEVLILGVE